MCKLLTFLIALGAIAFGVCSPAGAQFNGCGPGLCSPGSVYAYGYGFQGGCGGYNSACARGGTPQTPIYQGFSFTSGSGGSYSATGVSIGNPSYIATRRVIVFMGGLNDVSLTSGTINGVTATIHIAGVTAGSSSWMAAMSAVVTSGTSVTISLTTSVGAGQPTLFVYTIDNSLLASTTPQVGTNNTSTGTSLSATYSQTTGGCLTGFAASQTPAPSLAFSSPAYTTDQTFGSVNDLVGNFTPVPTTGTGTTTVTWTGTADVALGVLEWQ